ncbi:hypothetical protein D3C80_1426720 [compost metagenome]
MLMINAETIPVRVSKNRVSANSHCPEASITEMTVTRVRPMVSARFIFILIIITRIHTSPTAIGSLDSSIPPSSARTAPMVLV